MAVAVLPPPRLRQGGTVAPVRRRRGDEASSATSSTCATEMRVSTGPAAAAAAAAAPRNCDGMRIGDLTSYKRLRSIGGGAFGVVWKARHGHTGEVVTIKSVRSGGEALLLEAAMLAACAGNPAVVELREVARGGGAGAGMDDDLHLVMEFVGPSLHDVIGARRRAGRPFTESEVRRVVRRLLTGAATMHGHGVVHCDLKPGNVLVGEDDGRGRAIKICDLGLARSMAAPPPEPDARRLEGTLWYMAPEQLLGDSKDVGAPADVWALGCIMVELVAGEPLFREDTVHEQVASIVRLLGIPDEVSLMPLGVSASTPSQIRDMVPEAQLSPAGFDVLRALLEFDHKDRITAAAALQKPWFAMKDDD
ncbi:hypothetical protein ACP4OV_027405 [Aristida adscensionis]